MPCNSFLENSKKFQKKLKSKIHENQRKFFLLKKMSKKVKKMLKMSNIIGHNYKKRGHIFKKKWPQLLETDDTITV